MREYIESEFEELQKQDATTFNNDESFRERLNYVLSIKNYSSVGKASLDLLEAKGDMATPLCEIVAKRASDKNRETRLPAMQALMSISKKGDRHAIEALIPRFADDDMTVGFYASTALLRIAEKDDPLAIDGLISRLLDQEINWSRIYAAQALPCLDESSNQRVVEALAIAQIDVNSNVANRAKSGHQVLTRSDKPLLEALGPLFANTSWNARQGALRAQGQLATKGDWQAINQLRKLLRDEDVWVRTTGVQALG